MENKSIINNQNNSRVVRTDYLMKEYKRFLDEINFYSKVYKNEKAEVQSHIPEHDAVSTDDEMDDFAGFSSEQIQVKTEISSNELSNTKSNFYGFSSEEIKMQHKNSQYLTTADITAKKIDTPKPSCKRKLVY